MLLYNQKKRSQSNVKGNSIEGIYMSKERRIEQKRAFCGAHFSLGNRNQKFTTMSTTQALYNASEQQPLNSTTIAQTQQNNKALVQASRNSNFTISQSTKPAKFANQTSASHAYTPEKLKLKEQADVGDTQTMRVANFRMGFDKSTDYGTTTDQNNRFFLDESNRKNMSQVHHSQVLAQRDRVTANRVPHYDFGRTKVNYQTSNKGQFTQHDLSQVTQSKIDAVNNGKDVRQSHFMFGTDASEHKKNGQVGVKSTTYTRVNGSPGAAKTNIQIYHNGVAAGDNRFTSTYRSSNSLRMQPTNLSQRFARKQSADPTASKPQLVEKPSNTNLNLRKAHFSLGNNTDQIRSTNQSNLNEHAIPPNQYESRQELKARMAKTQFSIGTGSNAGMKQMQSLYSSEIDAQAQKGGQAANGKAVRQSLKRTNITIGNSETAHLVSSEAQTQFVQQRDLGNQNAQKKQNLSLVAKLKGHNFSLREQKQGGMVNNYFQTSHNETFNELGNPNEIRSRIPQAQRDDARKEHYYLGFDKSGFKKQGLDNTYNLGKSRPSAPSTSLGSVTPNFQRSTAQSVTAQGRMPTARPYSNTLIGATNTSASAQASNALMQANMIANKQKTCNVAMGGAPSNAKSTQGDRKTSNQSFFRWIQPKVQ